MADSVNQPGMVARLAAQDFFEVGADLVLILPVLHIRHQLPHHHHDPVVGAAVARPFQRADRRGNRGIDVGSRGGQHPRGERGVVAAAVLGVDHHADVQQLGFLVGEDAVGADGVQNGLRRGLGRVDGVEVHAFFVEMPALDLIGVRHDGGQAGNELDGLAHVVFQRRVVRVVIVGIQGQNRARELVHHVPRRRLDDHVLRKIFGQLAVAVQHLAEPVQLAARGLLPEKQQPGDFLVPEAVLSDTSVHDVVQVDAAVGQLALVRDTLAVGNQIPVHVADQRQTRQHTGPVGVPKAALHVVKVEFIRGNPVVRPVLVAEGFQLPVAFLLRNILLLQLRLQLHAQSSSSKLQTKNTAAACTKSAAKSFNRSHFISGGGQSQEKRNRILHKTVRFLSYLSNRSAVTAACE